MENEELFRIEFFYWYNDVLLEESLLFRGTVEDATDFAKAKMDVKREAGRDPFGMRIYRPAIYHKGCVVL